MVHEILYYQRENIAILSTCMGDYHLDYKERRLSPASPDYIQRVRTEQPTRRIAALLGIFNQDSTSYVIVATELRSIVKYRPCDGIAVSLIHSKPIEVLQIVKVDVLVSGNEDKYITRILKKHFSQPGLYCAFNRQFIETCKYKKNRVPFHWNANIIPSCSSDISSLESTGCVPFLICGYVEKSKTYKLLPNISLDILLISRRSLRSSGKRYFQRGIDIKGFTSNFVETELMATFCNEETSTAITFTHVSIRGSIPVCFHQVPNLSQKPPIKIIRTFPSELSIREFSLYQQRFEAQYPGTTQIYFNLLDGKGTECTLSRRLFSLCNLLANIRSLDKSVYTFTIDKHTASASRSIVEQIAPITPDLTKTKSIPTPEALFQVNFELFDLRALRQLRILQRSSLDSLSSKEKETVDLVEKDPVMEASSNLIAELPHYPKSNVILKTSDFFYVHLDFHSKISHDFKGDMRAMHYFLRAFERHMTMCDVSTQQSTRDFIYRINCLDSLDRTNTVQLCVCKEFIRKTTTDVFTNAIYSDFCGGSRISVSDVSLEAIFRDLNAIFWRHGNALSLQYASTNAMKGDLSLVGRRTFMGRLKDLRIWADRWFTCNFLDGPFQDGYLLLRSSPTNPLGKRDEIFHLSFGFVFWILFVFSCLLVTVCSYGTESGIIVGYTIILILALVSFISTSILLSRWYINWPRFHLDQHIQTHGEMISDHLTLASKSSKSI